MCALLVSLPLLYVLAAGVDTSEIYHLVINDDFFDSTLNADTMPVRVNGVIYVPYSVFDRNVAGADFKISYGQQREDGSYILTLYSINGALIFDLIRGTTTDVRGNSVPMRAILHSGRPFIPIQAVCTYFNNLAGTTLVQYVYTDTEYGALIRLRNEDCELSDFMFRQSALGAMRYRLNTYLQSHAPQQPTASVSPLATPTPAPSASAAPEPDSETPGEGGDTEVTTADTPPVYLAFACGEDLSGLEDIVQTLTEEGITAVFLFRTEELAGQAEQIRQAVGSGQTIGLIVSGSTAQEVGQAVDEGNDILADIAWTRARVVLAEETDRTVRQELEQAGIRCWQGNVDGVTGNTAATRASRIFNAVEGQDSAARITMDASECSADALSRLLDRLQAEEYVIRPAVETEF